MNEEIEWILIGNVEDIEEDGVAHFEYQDKDYAIYRLKDGFYATDGICSHENALLSDGVVVGEEIECPLHQGTFNIKTGEAIMEPACDHINVYEIKVEKDELFIGLPASF